MNPIEHVVIGFSSLAHKLNGFGGEVKIFKPVCFLLVENDTCKVVLRINVFPFEPLDVATAQTCQAGEQERPFDGRIMAFRPGKQPNLVYREVHPFSLFRLDALYSPYGIVRNDALVVCLVATGTQLVEIGNLAVSGERSVLYSVPAVLRPRTRLVFEVVLEAQDKLPVNVFPFERFQFRFVFEQVFQTGVPISPIPHAVALETLLAHSHIVLVEVAVLLERRFETILAVLQFDEPFRPDSLGELQRFLVSPFVLLVRFGD